GADVAGRARGVRLAVGRDRGHPGDAALRQGAEAARGGGRQRSELDDRARKRCRDADARRSRDRGRLDQGLHLPARGARLSRDRGRLAEDEERRLVQALIEVPRLMTEALALEPQIELLARDLAKSRDVLYLGRGTSYPLALEGALKLKEISYIHAEGYAAGELKHGPIALIDERMPAIVIGPKDRVSERTVSNMQEVAARRGGIILVTDPDGAHETHADGITKITLPAMPATVTPLVYAIPVQLIAYHTAVKMG